MQLKIHPLILARKETSRQLSRRKVFIAVQPSCKVCWLATAFNVEQSLLAVQMHTDPVTGTEYEDLARVASEYIFGKEPACDLDAGYRAAVFKDTGFNRSDMDLFLKRAGADLQNGDPVIAGVDNTVLHPELGIQGVHVILLTGMNKAASSNEIVSFTAMDPSYVWQKSNPAFFTISTQQLYEAFAACKEPGYVW